MKLQLAGIVLTALAATTNADVVIDVREVNGNVSISGSGAIDPASLGNEPPTQARLTGAGGFLSSTATTFAVYATSTTEPVIDLYNITVSGTGPDTAFNLRDLINTGPASPDNTFYFGVDSQQSPNGFVGVNTGYTGGEISFEASSPQTTLSDLGLSGGETVQWQWSNNGISETVRFQFSVASERCSDSSLPCTPQIIATSANTAGNVTLCVKNPDLSEPAHTGYQLYCDSAGSDQYDDLGLYSVSALPQCSAANGAQGRQLDALVSGLPATCYLTATGIDGQTSRAPDLSFRSASTFPAFNHVTLSADSTALLGTASARIQLMYIGLFGRAADRAGLEFWRQEFLRGGTLGDIQNAFLPQAEYQDLWQGKSPADFVASLYQVLFSRSGDPAGERY